VKTNVIETGEWERELEVEVPADRIDAEVTSATRNYRKQLEIPGFRRGKVPMRVVEARFGKSIRESVIGDLLPSLMSEAAQEAGLVPAATPKITKLEYEPGQPLSFTAALEIWPDVDVASVEGLKLTKLTHDVSDDEVEQQLKELQNSQATERPAERALAKGDVLIADMQRVDEAGIPIVGEKYDERYFLIGDENAPSPEFEEAVLGISAGEVRKVQFSYRSDLENQELAGKTEHFEVTAKEVRERTLPELDDEFAKDVGDQHQTLDDLRSHIRSQIEGRWQYISRQSARGELMDGLIRANSFSLPESLVENYMAAARRESEETGGGHAGHDHDHDHDHDQDQDHDHDQDDDEGAQKKRSDAARRLKSYLIMEALRKKLSLGVSDDEFEVFMVKRAEETGVRIEELKRSPRLADLRHELEDDKIFDYLAEHADIEEKSV
jgi:trigger factor